MFFKSKIISLISLSLFFSFLTVFAFTFSGFDQPLKSYKKEDKQGKEQTYNWYVSLGLGESWDLSSGHLGEDWVLLDQKDVDNNDISKAEIGQSVYSIADGIVFKVADWPECGAGNHGWGGVVLIKHQIPDDIDKKFNLTNTILPNPKGTEEAKKAEQKRIQELEEKGTKVVYSMYGHLKNIQVKEGDAIKKGDKVGEIGEVCYKNSTKKYTPHLHFEIKDQNAIDGEKKIEGISGIGEGYSKLDAYAPNRYIPSNFIENNKNLIVEEKSIAQPQPPSPPMGLTGGNDSLSFWDKIVFYWNGFVANVKEIFGGSTGEVQVAKPLTQTEVQQQTNNGSASSPSAGNNNNNKTEENSSPPLEPEVWNQKFISYKLDEKDKENGIYQLTLRFQNTGNTTWTKDDVSLNVVGGHQGTAAKFYHQSWTTKLRPTTLTTTINPGDIATFTFTLQFPKDPNTYYPQFQPVRYIKDINDFSWIGTDKAIFLAEVKQSSSSVLTFAGASVAEVINNDNDNDNDNAQNPPSPSPPNNTPLPTEEPDTTPEPPLLPVPVPILPNNEDSISELDNTNTTLTWRVEESSPQLTYVLEIDDEEGFEEPNLQKEINESQYTVNLDGSINYTLTPDDIIKLGLPENYPGNYFCRIKTKSNNQESRWSVPFSFTITNKVIVVSQGESIQAAVNTANPGDIIIVNDGTYQENININKANLTIKSRNGADKTIVKAASSNDHVFEITADKITINGFTIKGATGKAGIHTSGDNCKISNNTIENNYYGIRLWGNLNNIIENNIIQNNSKHGIYLTNGGSGHKIQNNTITQNNDTGIHLTSSVIANSITVKSNNIFGNLSYGVNNTSSTSLAATNNWWGDASGPYHETLNSSATGNAISNYINFTPWLDAPYPNGKSRSFNVFIDANKNGEYNTGEKTFYTVQVAVNAAIFNDTIIVYKGTYQENINIDKANNKANLTIKSRNGADNTIVKAADPNDHIFEITTNNIEISGFTIRDAIGGWYAGIYSIGNENLKVKNNIFSNNYISVWGIDSKKMAIENNIFLEKSERSIYGGIYLQGGNNDIIKNNIQNNVFNSSDNVISGNSNVISNNTFNSSSLEIGSASIQLENCSFTNGGILVSENTSNINLTVSNVNINNKPLLYLNGASYRNITKNNYGQIILFNCNNITVQGLNISNTVAGVQLINSSNNTITENTLNNNDYGVYMISSSNNNEIVDNEISFNTKSGVYLYNGCSNNKILNNNILHNNGYEGGIYVKGSFNIVSNNIINGNYYGIKLWVATNNTIKNNQIFNNNTGIDLYYATNNYIYNNNFYSNHQSIYIGAGNSGNVWNSPQKITYTYKGNTYANYLGNYWGGYKKTDTNGDGIRDYFYVIGSDPSNTDLLYIDYYPLIESFENYIISSQ